MEAASKNLSAEFELGGNSAIVDGTGDIKKLQKK